jgi:hypothetical protein
MKTAARPRRLWAGKAPLEFGADPVNGSRVLIGGEPFHRIANYDRMRPFFMTLVSSSDHWLFLSSTGALTAGRGTPDQALFPYDTDDKIHDAAEITGSKTVLWVERSGRARLWEPFSARYAGLYRIRRNLDKNVWGNQLIFEERNEDLGLTFRHGWFNSQRFGFVRKAWLSENGVGPVRIRLLDGLQNLMPCGVDSRFQLEKSTLLDAYKRSELLPDSGLALFRLSSIPVDRPEPAESLLTTTVWSVGLEPRPRLLSSVQLDRFRQGLPLRDETDVRGQRGAFWIEAERSLRRSASIQWLLAADVNRTASDVADLARRLRRPDRLRRIVQADIDQGTRELRRIVAGADGLQMTARPIGDARHSSNVLFNVMRGGVFADAYRLDSADLADFVARANREVAARHAGFLRRVEPGTGYADLVARAAASGDRQLERLCREYLPLTFSRRHGDPSRPWNRFSIAARKPDGQRVLHYEGNWRDIFQNWEALARSFPAYTTGMICRFVNASTADGYNPYRLTRDGIDWETPDPRDPWAHIGYWGDHQVIYLLKLLEICQCHEPDLLAALLARDIFAYANVPYRIHAYERLLDDPKETVAFDSAVETLVQQRVQQQGADGRLLWDERGAVRLVNLAEKLLVIVLAKLANFVPGAGIWLNTQRPEWNDANNALVGNGASVVTLAYLRRFLAFCRTLFRPLDGTPLLVSAEVAAWLDRTVEVLERHRLLLERPIDDRRRRQVLDGLGRAGSEYRRTLYAQGLSGRRTAVPGARFIAAFTTALEWVEQALEANRRPDGLYHAYNLLRFDRPNALPVRRLDPMLEGQVAILSSGRLTPHESLDLLAALRHSALYRADQHSYLLYPNRTLPTFVDRNNIPPRDLGRSRLLRRLLADGDRSLIERDVAGRCHFHGALTNAREVKRALDALRRAGYARLVQRESALVLDIYERLFDHASFTGRSGTFFAYEGLGSIYWHMVSKLLLAVQETFWRTVDDGATPDLTRRLAEVYYDIRTGLGDAKTPAEYGAFPADPYSHTPAHAGARQPGLTGQVKEDILCRLGELGIRVRDGRLTFQPALLRPSEFLTEPADFGYIDVAGALRRLRLPAGSLAFSYGQVPILYRVGPQPGLAVRMVAGACERSDGLTLSAGTSRSIFARDGHVRCITVTLPRSRLLANSRD